VTRHLAESSSFCRPI